MESEKSTNSDEINAVYDEFLSASDLTPALNSFHKLCGVLDINPRNNKTIFGLLKSKLQLWKCQTLFNKLEKKGKHKDYNHKPCAKLKVLVIGGGPVGLRTAIEAAYLGAYVVVVEKRNAFSRNNVLHLWPFLITDLKSIGVKSFFGKFCAGTLDHISIRRLQCILLKVCLILGVQVHTQTMMEDIVECTTDKGWRANFKPTDSPLNLVEFDAIIGCDGKNNALRFKRKEFRGKLAIAITCNFVNKKTAEEACVEEISGVAFIYNQEFFHELNKKTGIELENIVYYKDETHYFVMTAKKKSLLAKGVIKQDSKDVFKLLSAENINHRKLCDFGRESADFATKYKLPHHEFAKNQNGREDVALFDFTSIHQAESASKIIERRGKRLLLCIAGDILLEPFWPTGSGCARGFLGAMDACWMLRRLGLGHDSVDMIQERESIFTVLPQTKPDNLMQNHDKYSINPATRYCNLNVHVLTRDQAKNFYDCSSSPVHLNNVCIKTESTDISKPINIKQVESDHDILLQWCREQTMDFLNVNVIDFSASWKNGLAFCAIISHYRPDLINYSALNPLEIEVNCTKAFSVAEDHLGIPPKVSAHDFANQKNPDTLTIVAYVSLYYEAFKNETPAKKHMEVNGNHDDCLEGIGSNNWTRVTSKMTIISRLTRSNKKKKLKLSKVKKKKEKSMPNLDEKNVKLTNEKTVDNSTPIIEEKTVSVHTSTQPVLVKSTEIREPRKPLLVTTDENNQKSQVKYKRISLLAETVFGDTIVQMGNQSNQPKVTKTEVLGESEKCHFCQRKVFVIERQSAEGFFFHRTCFRCFVCKCQLLLGNFAFHVDDEDNGKFYCKMHYNRVIYETEKKDFAKTEKKRPYSTLIDVDQVPRGRTVTTGALNDRPDNNYRPHSNSTMTGDTENNIPGLKTIGNGVIATPKPSKINDIQSKFQGNPLELNLPNQLPNNSKYNFTEDKSSKSKNKGPYDKLSARHLVDRHPSLLRCGAVKITTDSFYTTSNKSVSTPNLSKLIQEDPLFEKMREEYRTTDNIQPVKVASTDDNTNAVNRRPFNEQRAHYPVSMVFSDGLVLEPVSIDIDIDDESTNKTGTTPVCKDNDNQMVEDKIKKKTNVFIRKKKKLIPSKELLEELSNDKISDGITEITKTVANADIIVPPPTATISKPTIDIISTTPISKPTVISTAPISKPASDLVSTAPISKPAIDIISTAPIFKPTAEIIISATIPKSTVQIINAVTKITPDINRSVQQMASDEDLSSSEEETKPSPLLKKKLGKKDKKKMAKLQEAKQKAKAERKIKKEMKAREVKRLWEAQSIQRKLNEVDVKQFELESKAKQLEKELQNESNSPEKNNRLTYEWISLVNEKNTLLRFESEFVIEANSIQLEDRQARLDQEIRALLTYSDPRRSSQKEIDRLTMELVDTVEQRNALIDMLEEDRKRELEEDNCLNVTFSSKAHEMGMDRLI